MELASDLKQMLIKTAETLTGGAHRVFMAGVAQVRGKGGQWHAELELGWNRRTLRKRQHELDSGLE